MFRKMQAEAKNESTPTVCNTMPHLECVDMISKVPVVGMVVNQTTGIYDKVKGSSSVANWTLTTSEGLVNLALETAAPVARKLEQPIHFVDQTLCKGLATLETKVPMVMEEPQELYSNAKGYVSATLQPTLEKVSAAKSYGTEKATSIKDYGWNKANDILATKWGNIALSGFDMTASYADKYLDYLLPAKESEEPGQSGAEVAAVEEDPKDKVSHTLNTMGRLSTKVRGRVYEKVVTQMQGLKKQSEHSIASLGSVLELIPSAMDPSSLSTKVNSLWSELSAEEKAETEGETGNVDQRGLLVARRLTKRVMTFCSQVPSTVSHLIPTSLAEQMEQASHYASGLYENLMTSSLRDISGSVQTSMKEQAGKVQSILHEFNIYAVQLMDAFVAKNKQLNEGDADVVSKTTEAEK